MAQMKIQREGVNRCNANLVINNVELKLNAKTQCVIKSEAEFPVKGSRTSPHDSSELRVEVFP